MTLVVGIEHRGRVYMGADSGSFDGDYVSLSRHPKIFTRDCWIVGFAGSWRVGELAQYEMRWPKVREHTDVRATLVIDVAQALRDTLRNANCVEDDWSLLVGANGELYEIDACYHVERVFGVHSAIGANSATLLALGNLDAQPRNRAPQARIERALKCAEFRCTLVRSPFRYLSL